MKRPSFFLPVLMLLLLLFQNSILISAPEKFTFVSPEANLLCFLSVENEKLFMSVKLNGKTVIEKSLNGIQ